MEILAENSRTGVVWNLSGAVIAITWETARRPTAARLELRYRGVVNSLQQKDSLPAGSLLTLREGGEVLFSGRVFVGNRSRGGEERITAYDQLRYLKAKDSMVRGGMRLDEFVRMGCGALGLRVGELPSTGLTLPKKVYDGKEWLASLEDSIREQNYLTGAYYCLYDKGGAIVLEELEGRRLPLTLGERSLAYDFEQGQSLEEAATRIKLVDKKGGGIYLFEDSDTQGVYGVLQHYETLPDGYNLTQISQLGKALLAVKNRVGETLSLSCIGDVRVRGGCGVRVVLGDLGLDQWLLVEKASHNWSGGAHTMKLELGVL